MTPDAKTTYIYFGYNADKRAWKIGVSLNPQRRARELGIYIEKVILCKRSEAYVLENFLLHYWSWFRSQGEWICFANDIDGVEDEFVQQLRRLETSEQIQAMAKYNQYYHVPKRGWFTQSSDLEADEKCTPINRLRRTRMTYNWDERIGVVRESDKYDGENA